MLLNEELVKQIQQNVNVTENMGLLYEQNRKFIYSIVSRFQYYEPLDDLMNEAYFGLHRAVQQYDAGKGVLFLTYAGHWIKQHVVRHIEECGSNIRLPGYMKGHIKKYNDVIKAFGRELNRRPTDAELRVYLRLNQEQLDNVKMAAIASREISLNTPLSEEDEDISIQDTLRAEMDIENSVIDKIYDEQLKADLWGLVDSVCTNDEAEVIRLRYKSSMSLRGVGEARGITLEAVRQKEAAALTKMRIGRSSQKFRQKYESELYSAYRGNIGTFRRTWTSSTERTALRLYEMGM